MYVVAIAFTICPLNQLTEHTKGWDDWNEIKIPKWYGYQGYYPTCRMYITSGSNKKYISNTTYS